MAYLNAENVGEPRRVRLKLLIDHALGHLNQWFVASSAEYVKSFMVGLSSHALISAQEATGDTRILPALIVALDRLWEMNWVPSERAFKYMSRITAEGDTTPSPDLNLLIAPAYAWVYYKTGELRFRDRADEIFAGGVEKAWLVNAKQFNQNYRWAFEYVKLRKMKPLR
jgi:hypothetical protein